MRASLVIPTLNEEESIGHVLATFARAAQEGNRTFFAAAPVDWEVLVVDGRSTDRTIERATTAGARVVLEPRPGYGRAYRTGFAAASGEAIATADGDATYPVERVPELLRQLLDENLDFLTTDRMAFVDRGAMTTEHRIGNRVLNFALSMAYHRFVTDLPGGGLKDSQSGMWVFRRDLLERIRLTQDGMAMSEEIKIEALVRGFRVREVPIRYGERWGAPKLSSWKDGQQNLLFLLEKRLELERELRSARKESPSRA
jgi:glycosyltransferase involved in cell wall biosynthesis